MGHKGSLSTITTISLGFVIYRAMWSSPVITMYITEFLKGNSQGLKTDFPVRDTVATTYVETVHLSR